MGIDGGGNVVDTTGSNANVSNLGIGADANYTFGPVLYDAGTNPAWCVFLRGPGSGGYGCWPNATGVYPVGVNWSRKYRFTADITGTHSYQCAVDNIATLIITETDTGNPVGDLSLSTVVASNYNTPTFGNVFLQAGKEYEINFTVANIGSGGTNNPGSFAFRLMRPSGLSELWSTKTAIRTAYRYWNEVCRIPLYNSTNAVYYSKDYLIKNQNLISGESYGYYFGETNTAESGSMFTVTQTTDNTINIKLNTVPITTNNSTIDYAYALPFYYSTIDQRIRNIDNSSADGTNSPYFLGFTEAGSVITEPRKFPKTASVGGGGFVGGGGDTGIPISPIEPGDGGGDGE